MARFFISTAIVLLFAGGPFIQTIRADAAAEAEQLFKDLYGTKIKQVSASISRSDDIELAKQMLASVGKAKAELLIVLFCDHAYELAMRHPDGYPVAADAMRTLAAKVPAKANHAHEQLLETLNRQFRVAQGDERSAAGEALIDAMLAQGNSLAKVDKVADAITAFRKATIIAVQTNSPRRNEIKNTLDAMTQRRKDLRMAELLEEKVLKDRSDHASAEALAKLYIVELIEPEKAKPLASAVKDASLRMVIKHGSLAPASLSPIEVMAMASWHIEAAADGSAGGAKRMLNAAASLLKSVADTPAIDQVHRTKAQLLLEKIRKQLAQLDEALSGSVEPALSIRRGHLPKPLAMYTFDKNTILRKDDQVLLADLSHGQYHGVIHGMKLKEGVSGEAGFFAGNGECVTVKPLMDALAKGLTEITLSCWVNLDKIDDYNFVFAVGVNADKSIALDATSGSWRAMVLPGKAKFPITPAVAKAWQHLTLVWGDGRSRLYVNGILKDETPAVRVATSLASFRMEGQTAGNVGWNTPRIGSQAKAHKRAGRSAKGLIDELVIYPRVLSAQQVKLLYKAGQTGVSLRKLH